jgi:hypothetical protein
MSLPPDLHGPTDEEEARLIREALGFRIFRGRRHSCIVWGRKGGTKELFLPAHKEIAEHVWLWALEDVNIPASTYHALLRKIRGPYSS